jgi:hypothetical protein
MPTPYLKKLSEQGKGSVPSLEKKWDKAKGIAKGEGKGDNYGLITHILQNETHTKPKSKANTMSVKLNAATRLLAAKDDPYNIGVEKLIDKRPNINSRLCRALRAYADEVAAGADQETALNKHVKPNFIGSSGEHYFELMKDDLKEVGAFS